MRLESITFQNSNPILPRASSSSSMALCHARPASLGFQGLFGPKRSYLKVQTMAHPTKGPRLGFNLRQRSVQKRTLSSFAASHEESKASDNDSEKEKDDVKTEARESQEAWQQTLASFKEQALRMQSVSKEAYDDYSAKAAVILKETSEKLKIQAEKARQDLTVIANEIAEESKDYLTTAAENSPEPVKDIVETFTSSTDEYKDISKLQDFYVGIPYGALLSLGGFLSFMVTGSVPAIRFGIILGGTLLALSISSLRQWKKGESSPVLLKGQAAIATILFLRKLRLLFLRPFIINIFMTLISGGVAAFFLYRIIRDGGQSRGPNLEASPEN